MVYIAASQSGAAADLRRYQSQKEMRDFFLRLGREIIYSPDA
jgi:hypothetical protein